MARPICARLDHVVQPIRAELASLRGGAGSTADALTTAAVSVRGGTGSGCTSDGVSTSAPSSAPPTHRSAAKAGGISQAGFGTLAAGSGSWAGGWAGRSDGGRGPEGAAGEPSQLGGWAKGLMSLAGWGVASAPPALPAGNSQVSGSSASTRGGGSGLGRRAVIASAPANDLVVVLDDWEGGGGGGGGDGATVSVSSGGSSASAASPPGSPGSPRSSESVLRSGRQNPPTSAPRPSPAQTPGPRISRPAGAGFAAAARGGGRPSNSPASPPASVAWGAEPSRPAGAAAPRPPPPTTVAQVGGGDPGDARHRQRGAVGSADGGRDWDESTPPPTATMRQQQPRSQPAARALPAGAGESRGGRGAAGQLVRAPRRPRPAAEGGR
jgi:hypothetical protein